MVQVELLAIPPDIDAVSASRNVLVVQRLMQVADEMDNELGSLSTAPGGQRVVRSLLRVVGQGVDDAARLLAVALEVDVARQRRVIVRIDEVECLGELTPFGVSDGVGPRGDLGEVVVFVAA